MNEFSFPFFPTNTTLHVWIQFCLSAFYWCFTWQLLIRDRNSGSGVEHEQFCLTQAILINCFVSHRPTDPFFLEKKNKIHIHCQTSKILILNLIHIVCLMPCDQGFILNRSRYLVYQNVCGRHSIYVSALHTWKRSYRF